MEALLTAYSLSGAAGIRTSLTMFIVACLVNTGTIHPPQSLEWVGSWWMILLSLSAALVDFFGDKVPLLDHALHGIHFILAPVAGAVVMMTGHQGGDPAVTMVLGLLGGANAFALHGSKTTLRAAGLVVSGGLANPLISIVEDIVVALFIFIAIAAPALTALLLILATVWVFRKLKQVARRRQRVSTVG